MEREGVESLFALGYRWVDGSSASSRIFTAGDLVRREVSGTHEVVSVALDAIGGGWGWRWILKVVRPN
jgi:hypothetical protein